MMVILMTSLLYDRRSMMSFKQLHQLSEYVLLVYNKSQRTIYASLTKNISVWLTVSSRQNARPFFFTKIVTSEVYAIELLEPFIAQLTENEIMRFSRKMAQTSSLSVACVLHEAIG